MVDRGEARAIGYLSIHDIDWETRQCGNMGIRVHPEWRGKGIGSRMLAMARDWWLANGMESLRLDVAASNTRAVRCCEKAGFSKTGEFWREAPDLRGVDVAGPGWRFLAGRVRLTSATPELRFLLMQLKAIPRPGTRAR